MRRLARDQGARVMFVYCECPPAVARERLGIRLTDPEAISDGRVELFEDQMRDFDPFTPEDRPLLRLDTTRDPAVVLEELKDLSKVMYRAACGRGKSAKNAAKTIRYPSALPPGDKKSPCPPFSKEGSKVTL